MYFPGNDQDFGGGVRMQMRPGGSGFARTAESQAFSFGDLIDTLNPLQHIPVVSTLYREMTGDQIAAAPRMMGSVLYGGATGIVTGAANAVAYETTGKDLGENAMAAVFGGGAGADGAASIQMAEAGGSGTSPTADQPTGRNAPAAVPAATASTEPAPAPGPTQASGGTGPGLATGNAALQALMHDLQGGGQLQGAAQPGPAAPPRGEARDSGAKRDTQRDAAARTPESSTATGNTDRDRADPSAQQQAAAPSSFMPIRERDMLSGTGPRKTFAALQAEGDMMGSKRVRVAPTDARTTLPHTDAGTDGDSADGRAPAMQESPTARDSSAAAPGPGTGDFSARMMRALEKYKAMQTN